ncbi:YicC/YloC family endoribonuclease [Lachnospira pectinoschiza]|uniref:TIGR00255 family protein n=1 Tax=Lachnospira pectinoschiza TaxID=28052 RepID=A0A1G9VRL4_9FIRM|nr:YicC/YloC family endoribonuclease [Lachnospira pectinoschiza]SDM74621.1 TIGR00255 family protein [Lachnospira pectinoschiza]
MIKSMTGFGRSEILRDNRKILVEVKSVNHRYLEAGIKMPKKLNSFESRIRETLKKYANRGKVDIFINYEDNNENQVNIKYNDAIAKEYMDIFKKMSEEFNIENDVNCAALSRYPEVITMEEVQVDEEELWAFIEEALKECFSQFVETRILEGENLKKDLLLKLDHMEELVDFIEKRSPEIMKEYRGKLDNKIKEVLGDTNIDEQRIATELVIYADKICVDEETVRLRSHINHARKCLSEDGGVGRKMDFIAQEMNRESNTILSKANDIDISNAAIDLKTEIEKVREQIQNIE